MLTKASPALVSTFINYLDALSSKLPKAVPRCLDVFENNKTLHETPFAVGCVNSDSESSSHALHASRGNVVEATYGSAHCCKSFQPFDTVLNGSLICYLVD